MSSNWSIFFYAWKSIIDSWSTFVQEKTKGDILCSCSGSWCYFRFTLMLSNTSVFSYCPVEQQCIPSLSDKLCFNSRLFKTRLLNTKPSLSGQPTHAWASTANDSRAALPNEFLCAKAAMYTLSKYVTLMSKRHRIKGGATDEAFQEQGNLWERGVPAGVDFDLFNWSFTCTRT